jgi:cytochrome P450
MQFTKTRSLAIRLKGELPPSGKLPATLQTAGCRWFAYSYFEEAHRRYGERFTVYPIYMPPLVFLSNPEDIRAVLTADPTVLHPGAGSAILRPLIGERSFMLLEEDEHLVSRRAIAPPFHQKVVRRQTAMLRTIVERDIANWPENAIVAVHPRIRSLTLQVVLKAIFGDATPLDALHSALLGALNISASILLQEANLRYLPGWRLAWREFVTERAAVDSILYAIMHSRRRERGDEPELLIDLLLDETRPDGSPMPEQEIRDNLMSMILAGHETTTGELAWAFQLLAHNQRAQDRLLDEIDRDQSDEYLTATINETMRRKPVFLFVIPREVMEPVEIGGWTYRPPAHLAGCTYLMHHNPDLYRQPFQFMPERFIEESQTPRTWLPWGGGRKHCLGRHFAMLEVKTVLREALSEHRVLPTGHGIEPPRWRSAILVPGGGGRVVLSRRKSQKPMPIFFA